MELASISKGKIKKPYFVLLYAPDGVGKTTFAADAPDPVFIPTEDGCSQFDVSRFAQPKTLSDVYDSLHLLLKEDHEHKTVVIDTLDHLEPLIFDKVCRDHKKNSIEEVAGGYGKGYLYAQDECRSLIKTLLLIRDAKKMNVVLLGHSQIKTFIDPQRNVSYDRYSLKVNEKCGALYRENADCVLFANHETFVKGDPEKKVRAYSDGARVMFTERRASFDAKNRFGLPFQLPLSWDEFDRAATAGKDFEKLKASIVSLTAELTDDEAKKKVMAATEAAGKNTDQLEKIINRLNAILGG